VDVPQAATILSAYQEARALLIGKSVAQHGDEVAKRWVYSDRAIKGHFPRAFRTSPMRF
jgi:hypothetical protein